MSAVGQRLTREQIAIELDRIRSKTIAAKQRDFPAIPREELENAYGDITLGALDGSFATASELVKWVHEALRHDALDIAKSARFRARPYGGCRPAWAVDIGRSLTTRSWGYVAVRVAPRAAPTTA
jgi:hypothetical protein